MPRNSLILPAVESGGFDIGNAMQRGAQIRETMDRNALQPLRTRALEQGIEGTQDTNALNKIKLKEAQQVQLYREMAPEVAAWNNRWESVLAESKGDRQAALSKLQPLWEAYVPAAKEKGYPVTDTFDPESTKAFLNVLKANKIIGDENENLSSTNLVDPKTGLPFVYNKAKGTFKLGKVEGDGTPTQRPKQTKINQSVQDRDIMLQEVRKRFPDATEGEFMLASKSAQATGNPIDRELKKIIVGRTQQAQPAKTETPKKGWWESRLGKKSGEQKAAQGKRTPAQQSAFDVLRKNPKNKGYSDDQLWQAIAQRGI